MIYQRPKKYPNAQAYIKRGGAIETAPAPTLSVCDGIRERRIIYFEICPLCSTLCPPAAVAAAISYPVAAAVAMAKGVWADDDDARLDWPEIFGDINQAV